MRRHLPVLGGQRRQPGPEVGCASESCFVACHQDGGRVRRRHQLVLRRLALRGGSCAACAWGGQTCTTTGDCCTGLPERACIDGLGGTCVSQAGCSQGECRDGRCQCAADQILCNTGCVSYPDPNNCRGCGNVCPTGTGRVCTANGCVCDPQSALPDECNGVCVNKSNDRTNCGFCFMTCPRLDQVCTAASAAAPAARPTATGAASTPPPARTTAGCATAAARPASRSAAAGNCACAPGYTRCSGNCVNLLTSKLNCSACGMACPGNKTCNNGSCG